MPTGATGQLGLALPVQGELSGTWGNTVNNAITEYTNIAIAATLTLTNDGAVTLANTTGTDLATNIVSSLTGAGTVTAQFAIVRVTGTLTTAKVVTAPSYSKTYTVVNAATGGIVTFKASGQTGVSIAVGESAFVYYNGTDYVKVSSTVATGVTSFTAGTTGLTPNTATTGAVTLAGTLATANGGTGLTSFTSGGVVYASSSSALATGSALQFNGSQFGVNTTPSQAIDVVTDGASSIIRSTAYRASDGQAGINLRFARGSVASPTIVLTGDTIGTMEFYPYNGTNFNLQTALISAKVTGTVTTSNIPTALVFGLDAAGAAYSNEQMRLTSTGLGIGTSSPAVKLHVFNAASTADQILEGGGSNNGANLYFYADISGSGNKYRSSISGINASGSALTFATTTNGNTAPTERVRISSAGNFGIATSSPRATLDVNGSAYIAGGGQLQITGNAGTTGLQLIGQDAAESTIGTMGSQPLVFRTASAEKARFSTAGGFSVGTTSDPGAGAIYATGNITAFFSDKRLKTVSGKIENALDKVAQLSGVYYTFNDTAKSFGYDSDEIQVGVLAQDVEAVLPQIVKAAPFDLDQDGNSKSGENYKTVQYDKLVPLLIEAVKELTAKVKALEAK